MRAFALSEKRVPSLLSVSNRSHRERDDNYRHVVARLNARWRVIECRDGIQWIVQSSKKWGAGTRWESRGYCRTRQGLFSFCTRLVGDISSDAKAVLASLPEWMEVRR